MSLLPDVRKHPLCRLVHQGTDFGELLKKECRKQDNTMLKYTEEKPDLPLLGRFLSARLEWLFEPDAECRSECNDLLHSFLQELKKGKLIIESENCTVEKINRRKIILRHCTGGRQFYFKIFLPDFSWRWKRGLALFPYPAIKEAAWLEYLQNQGIGAVDPVGVAKFPWKHALNPVQEPSVVITASPENMVTLTGAVEECNIRERQRSLIALTILKYAETLHSQGVGHLDFLPNNILFDPDTDEVRLCDMERTSWLWWGNRNRRIRRDGRKLFSTIVYLLQREEYEAFEESRMLLESMGCRQILQEAGHNIGTFTTFLTDYGFIPVKRRK